MPSAQTTGAYVTVPFWSREGVDAVRFDAPDRSRSLDVFWGGNGVLEGLRARLSLELWRQLRGGFTQARLRLPAFDLHRDFANYAPGDWTGSPARRLRSRGFNEATEISASLSRLSVRLAATPKDATRPVWMSETMDPTPQFEVLAQQVFDEPPLMCVVEDTRTGLILLLGEHPSPKH